MGSIKDILCSTELILPFFIILGLSFAITKSFAIIIDYLLGIVMFFSIRPFFQHEFNLKERSKPILISILLSYVVLSGAFLLLGTLFFEPLSPYHIGFILLAIIPPAISIIPLCYMTQCDPETADASLFVSYLLALIIIPITLYALFGQSLNIWMLVQIMITIILVPMILAFLLRKVNGKIFSYTRVINNLCIGIVLFIAISLNRESFFILNNDILKIYLAVFLAIFGLGLLTYYILKRYFPLSEAVNFSLYATQKNEGTALAIAVLMFTPETVVPIIIALVLQFIYFMIFEKYVIPQISN